MHFYFTPSDGFLSGDQGSMASQRFTVQYMVSCDRKNSKVLLSLIHHDHEEWRYTQLPVTSFVLRYMAADKWWTKYRKISSKEKTQNV